MNVERYKYQDITKPAERWRMTMDAMVCERAGAISVMATRSGIKSHGSETVRFEVNEVFL